MNNGSVKNLRIGITDCGKFENYRKWISSIPGTEVIKLSSRIQNFAQAAGCDGIVFSGGEDIQPSLYGKPEYVDEYNLQEIIPDRDAFEYKVLDEVFNQKIPILGICRGLQLINVYLGGTLLPDIPTLFRSRDHGKINGLDQIHPIEVETHTLLHNICGGEHGNVNSAHHQSVDSPADSLRISAYSEPSIVEALEWKEPANKNWLLTVQWHPERMIDQGSSFSNGIRQAFLAACTAV